MEIYSQESSIESSMESLQEYLQESLIETYCNSVISIVDSPLHNTLIYTINTFNFKKNEYQNELLSYSQNILNKIISLSNLKYNKSLIQIHFNLKGLTIKKVDYNFIKKILNTFQNIEDDTVERIIITDIPVFFKVCYNIIKPCINNDLKKKIYFEKKRGTTINYTNNDKELLE